MKTILLIRIVFHRKLTEYEFLIKLFRKIKFFKKNSFQTPIKIISAQFILKEIKAKALSNMQERNSNHFKLYLIWLKIEF